MPDKIPFSEFTFRGSTYVLKDAVARAAIDQLNSFEYVVCTSAEDTPINITWGNVIGALLPDVDTTHKIYLVPSSNGSNDTFDEYLTIKNGNEYLWEKIGNTDVDLTGYVVKDNAVVTSSLSMGRLVNTEVGNNSVALGQNLTASGVGSHAEGINTTASGRGSHAEGQNTIADGIVSHIEGRDGIAKGSISHVEGNYGYAAANYSHVEGSYRLATGTTSHAEGGTLRRSYTSGALLWANENEYTCLFYSSVNSMPRIPTDLDVGWTIVVKNEFGITITTVVDIDTSTNTFTVDRPFVTSYNECPFVAFKSEVAGQYSHAEGYNTTTKANVAHAEGYNTIASGYASHSAGMYTIANGIGMQAIGKYNISDTPYNEWQSNHQYELGDKIVVNGVGKICIEANNDTTYDSSKWQTIYQSTQEGTLFVIGNGNEDNDRSNAFRVDTFGTGYFSGDVYVNNNQNEFGGTKLVTTNEIPIENGSGIGSIQSKTYENQNGIVYTQDASGVGASALGMNAVASGTGSFAEGSGTIASGSYSHSEGRLSIAKGNDAHAEGAGSYALGNHSHAEGYNRLASGSYAHAEGSSGVVYVSKATVLQGSTTYTFTSSTPSNLDIGQTMCIGDSYVGKIIAIDTPNRTTITLDTPFDKNYSDVPFTIYYADASGTASHVEGMNTHASGNASHAEGIYTIAASAGQHVQGKYNIVDSNDTYADIVGNGTNKANRSNAYVLDWNGNARFAGDVYVGCNSDSTGGTKLATINDLPGVPVQDVQVNGVSVLNQNGIANVPIGGSNILGVVKTASGYGITINTENGVISIDKSDDSLIKSGIENYRPIVPSSQHSATFYGLAKAAGDLTQSQSSNAVGTYTPEAKAAIQTMLGIETGTEVVRLI